MRNRVKLGRPSHSTLVAYLALFVALGGSAYAFHLGKNSVGTKQLKKEAVTAAKVRKGTLTGTQIQLSSLGTVPSAANAQALDGQSAAQLASASKLDCPSGMGLYDGVCFQEATKSPTNWFLAFVGCKGENLRLPSAGELAVFEGQNFTAEPPPEWTEPESFSGTESWAWIVSASSSSAILNAKVTGGTYAYRCVTLASN